MRLESDFLRAWSHSVIIPDKDNGHNFERNFWHAYIDEIREILNEGIHIHHGKAFRGDQKTKEGMVPSSKIKIDFFFRADLMGHYAYLQRGGPQDEEGKFCLHCNEKRERKKAPKFFELYTVPPADSAVTWNDICEEFCMYSQDLRDLNLLVRCGNGALELFEGCNEEDMAVLRSDSNRKILDDCMANPDKLLPAGSKIAIQRYIPICREFERLAQLRLTSIDFIYCTLHLKLRFCNTIVKYIHSIADNNRKLSLINEVFERNCVQIQLSEKRLQEYKSQLDGKQCDDLVQVLPELIRVICGQDMEKVSLWEEAIKDLRTMLSLLQCQHYNRITREEAKSMPFLIRSVAFKLIRLIGQANLLRSYYLHSAAAGHVGSQWTYLYEKFGYEIGLLSMSTVCGATTSKSRASSIRKKSYADE
eukprot:756614-Hanusia_phi.AAC.2